MRIDRKTVIETTRPTPKEIDTIREDQNWNLVLKKASET